MFTLSDTTNNSPNKWNFVFLLAQPPMSPVLRALASPGKPWQGLKGKNPRLQHQSEQFWVAQKPTKGGGGGRADAPPQQELLVEAK